MLPFQTKGSTGNGEKIDESRLIFKATLVINENSKRREKIANGVAEFAQEYRLETAWYGENVSSAKRRLKSQTRCRNEGKRACEYREDGRSKDDNDSLLMKIIVVTGEVMTIKDA